LRDVGFAYAQYFKNHGARAGASLNHAHGQIIALADVPPAIVAEAAATTGNCLYCALIERELTQGERIVRTSEHWLTMTAVAGRFPYETWLLPRQHAQHFEDIINTEELAGELHWLLSRLDSVITRPAYNLILHTGPWTGGDFHWHFELLPRMTGVAGFEWGTGVFINPMAPEDAAQRLRG
jgi:UDPglucose--hexose-1-phosphate uridylyltransferase